MVKDLQLQGYTGQEEEKKLNLLIQMHERALDFAHLVLSRF